jgi:hypothetical protein
MNVHQNARLTPHSRAELVRRVDGQSKRRGVGWEFVHVWH